MKILLFALFMTSAHASILKNEVIGLKRKVFTLKEACEKSGFKHLLLVEASGPASIDCMGRELSVQDFCQNLHDSNNLLRGFVSKSKSQAYCEYGESVSLTLKCDKDHYKYCQNDKKGCNELKPIFAKRLELMHSSLTGVPTNLNCHYSVSELKLPDNL